MRKCIIFALLLPAFLFAVNCTGRAIVPEEPQIDEKVEHIPTYSTMKLVSYNILQGMKYDKANNFDNFAAWVQKQNPDVLALQETNGFTENTLLQLARRWGHNYVVRNVGATEYNVAFTSRYPITVINKMKEEYPLTRGAIHIQVKGINFIVIHLWPYSVYPKDTGPAGSGEAYRLEEVTYILDNTFNQPDTGRKWLMMGDFNCPAECDEKYIPSGTWTFAAHRKMLSYGYFDLVRETHSAYVPSTQNGFRLDFIYGTRPILSDIVSTDIIYDDFTNVASDHHPISVVFRYIEP